MTMTNEEIIRDYKAAKAPSKQINILADLNQCDRKKIMEILVAGGCKLPGNCVGTKTKSRGVPLAGPEPQEPAKTDIVPQEPAKLPGAKSTEGKLVMRYVPTQIIREIAKVREYGNAKYSDPENWKSVDLEKFHDALLRHILAAWNDPSAVDPESGLPHLSHAACNLAFILEDLYGGGERNG